MSSDKVSQQLFLEVKQKLDNYHLPTAFPIEATPLISKLIKLINKQNPKAADESSKNGGQQLSAALRHQMSHILKQNNKLHLDLMTSREEIQSLQHRIYKLQANKNSQARESEKVSSLKSQREQELFDQLRQVKYKYNELMDFLHQDPKADREYIKRLMKHRHEKVDEKSEQMRESNNHHYSRQKNESYSSQVIKQLESKVKNRQAEILRLQGLIEYDGMNMNKIIKNFQDSLVKNKLKEADLKINYLEESMGNVKKENQKMKNNNGSKQALRVQVEKCHKVIETLRNENRELKRNHKQQNFDVHKELSEQERKVTKIRSEKHQAQKQNQKKEQQRQQLEKKIAFLEKESKQLRQTVEDSNKQLQSKEQGLIVQSQRNEQLKVFYEYEIENYKKKLHELQFQNHQIKLVNKKLLLENEIMRRQSDLKSESIINLQKIVNQLLKKNNLLSDHSVGVIEQSNKRNEDFETKRQIIDLQQQLIYSQNQKAELESNRNAVQHRFGMSVKENERFKIQLHHLRADLLSKENLILQLSGQLQQTKFVLKKTQADHSKLSVQLNDLLSQKNGIQMSLKKDNDSLSSNQRHLKLQIRSLELKLSQEQGVQEIIKIKLDEREERIRQIERLLNETVEQSKRLAGQVAELDHQNHQLARQNHRYSKKYEQLKKQAENFKNNSFKNYQHAINDNTNEVNSLKKQIMQLAQSEERLTIRYDEVSNLLNLVRREKQMQEVDKISLSRQNEHLQIRLAEMQDIERALVIENQSLRNLARRL